MNHADHVALIRDGIPQPGGTWADFGSGTGAFTLALAECLIVQRFHGYLRPGGRLILVEYNVDRGNMWVPHPLSYQTWQTIAARNGFVETQLLAARPSRFLHEIYAAISQK